MLVKILDQVACLFCEFYLNLSGIVLALSSCYYQPLC